ncbi:hypothetical protein Emed_007377 [Eimeria media]
MLDHSTPDTSTQNCNFILASVALQQTLLHAFAPEAAISVTSQQRLDHYYLLLHWQLRVDRSGAFRHSQHLSSTEKKATSWLCGALGGRASSGDT